MEGGLSRRDTCPEKLRDAAWITQLRAAWNFSQLMLMTFVELRTYLGIRGPTALFCATASSCMAIHEVDEPRHRHVCS